jgi:hypothetical protein
MEWDSNRFQNQLTTAKSHLEQILHNDRVVIPLEDGPHRYEDKYSICEFVTVVALGSYQSCLENLGIDAARLNQLITWSGKYSVTLKFNSTERSR